MLPMISAESISTSGINHGSVAFGCQELTLDVYKPRAGIENEYTQEILFRPLREIDRSVDGGASKEVDQTFHRSVPVTSLSNLFSIEAVSVTGFCCTTMLSSDVTETQAICFYPKEVSSVMQKRRL